MLSAKGIDAGAGVKFEFSKSYKVVSVHAEAFFDVWGYVSFERPQIGGGIAVGGKLEVKLFGFGLNISLAAILTVEAAKPFKVAGSAEVCVSVNLRIKKIEKCVSVDFVWMKSTSVDETPIDVLSNPVIFPATARHMQSGRTYENALRFQSGLIDQPTQLSSLNAIPLDTFIDFQFLKPVKPALVSQKITGSSSGPRGDVEVVPPKSSSRKVNHSYAVQSINIQIHDGTGWVDYNPYRALYPGSVTEAVGSWQRSGLEYNKLRFLSLNSFSYMDPVGGYEPEGMGLDAQTLFCAEKPRERRCVKWAEVRDQNAGLAKSGIHFKNDLFYEIIGEDGTIERVSNPFGISRSLIIPEAVNCMSGLPSLQPISA